MKKLLGMVALLAVSLTSCEEKKDDPVKQDPPKETAITGTWVTVEVGYLQYEDDVFQDTMKSTEVYTLALNTDKSFTYKGLYREYSNGTYTYTNDELVLTGKNDTMTWEVELLTETELKAGYVVEFTEFGVEKREEYYYEFEKK